MLVFGGVTFIVSYVSYMRNNPPNLEGLFAYKGRFQRFAKVFFPTQKEIYHPFSSCWPYHLLQVGKTFKELHGLEKVHSLKLT